MSDLLARLLDLEKKPAARPYTDEAYNLAAFRAWVDELGAPDRGLRFLHIAGTKGKGSTSALCEAMLLGLGHRTGMYSSPHLEHYGERIRIAGVALTADAFDAAVAELERRLSPTARDAIVATGLYRTVFEVLTAAALIEFQRAACDAIVWETGLGGRLDCTNIVEPVACAITVIGLDHTQILGTTHEAIASEKAGIIKPGHPVVIQRQVHEGARAALVDAAHRAGAEHHAAEELCRILSARESACGIQIEFQLPDGGAATTMLPLRGGHQVANFATAASVCWLFERASGRRVTAAEIAVGVPATRWQGRLEVVDGPGGCLVLDGAHCPLSARRLGEALVAWQELAVPPARPPYALVIGMQADKDHAGFFRALAKAARPVVRSVFAYRVPGGRGAEAASLAVAAREAGFPATVHDSPTEALDAARASSPGSVLAAGTLYTIASFRRHWLAAQNASDS